MWWGSWGQSSFLLDSISGEDKTSGCPPTIPGNLKSASVYFPAPQCGLYPQPDVSSSHRLTAWSFLSGLSLLWTLETAFWGTPGYMPTLALSTCALYSAGHSTQLEPCPLQALLFTTKHLL